MMSAIKLLIGDKFLLLPCGRVVLIIALGYVLLFVSVVNCIERYLKGEEMFYLLAIAVGAAVGAALPYVLLFISVAFGS